MKKLIGVLMALAIAVTGFAFAETMTLSTPAQQRYILVEFAGGDLAVLGAGDGGDLFDAFTSDDKDYAQRYEDLWRALSMLEPAMKLDVSADELSFDVGFDGKSTTVALDGKNIAEFDGLTSFAMLSGNGAKVTANVDCDVHVWTAKSAQSIAAGAAICPNCGKVDDGSDIHDTVISSFCNEEHTQCMGDPIHHCDICGKDYPCSKSNSHTKCAKCGNAWCYKEKGDHKELACGHRGCEVYGHEAEHEKCICGGYLCDGKDHELSECGHCASQISGHEAEHALCGICGEYLCNGADHDHAAVENAENNL